MCEGNSVYAGDSLQEITVHDEARDMWRIYLDQQDYKSAFRHCKSQVQHYATPGLFPRLSGLLRSS